MRNIFCLFRLYVTAFLEVARWFAEVLFEGFAEGGFGLVADAGGDLCDVERFGILDYSSIDKRYEWNTPDNFNEMMMTYKGEKDSAKLDSDIVMVGEFTDAGIFPDKSTTGKMIKQRTTIKIESNDRNIMEIYLTLPGKTEFLADRVICTRRK